MIHEVAPYQHEPRPLTIESRKLIVSWSAKSACSHVVLWTFRHEGLFRAANYFNPWPHEFRQEVYYRSTIYRRVMKNLVEKEARGYALLKVTRDPVKRLVSIFRHVCRYAFLQDQAENLSGLDLKANGLSLTEFGELLEKMDLVIPTSVNPHVRAQYHPIWDMPFDRSITLNMDQTNLNDGLNAVERELNLPVTQFDTIQKFAGIAKSHYAKPGTFERSEPLETYRFRAHETDAFPKKQLEASPLARQIAARCYGTDEAATKSGDTAGKLFA